MSSGTYVDDDDPRIVYHPTGADPWYFLGVSGDPGIYDGSLSEILGVGSCSFTFNGE